MKFYIKEDRWEDFKRNYKKYGFEYWSYYYVKFARNDKTIHVYVSDKRIEDTKSGDEPFTSAIRRHRTKTYIMDLIADGYIEARSE